MGLEDDVWLPFGANGLFSGAMLVLVAILGIYLKFQGGTRRKIHTKPKNEGVVQIMIFLFKCTVFISFHIHFCCESTHGKRESYFKK